jgi:hypothetical protein
MAYGLSTIKGSPATGSNFLYQVVPGKASLKIITLTKERVAIKSPEEMPVTFCVNSNMQEVKDNGAGRTMPAGPSPSTTGRTLPRLILDS